MKGILPNGSKKHFNFDIMNENRKTMKIAITGGKGGTGKSTISTSLAFELSNSNRVMLVDADVECPDDHIILSTTQEKVEDVEALLPTFDQEKCTQCGSCSEVCKENAVVFVKDRYPFIVSGQCNGCGACLYACPSGALQDGKQVVGTIYQGKCQRANESDNLILVWGEIEIGCENTSLVVKATRDYALNLISSITLPDSDSKDDSIKSSENNLPVDSGFDYVLIDTAAGTHCNVINAMINVDLALAVTEPTPLGKHDLELILSLLEIMETPAQIIVNKSDMGDLNLIRNVSENFNIPLIQEIPYEKDIMKKHSRSQPVTHESFKELADSISDLQKTMIEEGRMHQ